MTTMWPELLGLTLAAFTAGFILAAIFCAAGHADATIDRARDHRRTMGRLDQWEATLREGYPLSRADTLHLIEAVRYLEQSVTRLRAQVLTQATTRRVVRKAAS